MYEQKMCATADKTYNFDKSVINTRTKIAVKHHAWRLVLCRFLFYSTQTEVCYSVFLPYFTKVY